MSKIVLCDVPNTLFDSRHRTHIAGVCQTNILSDQINYTALSLVKSLQKDGYTVVFTHYMHVRTRHLLLELLRRYDLDRDSYIYTNFMNAGVFDNKTLKIKTYEHLMEEYGDVSLVIDNDETMTAFWLDKGVGLLTTPLPILR